MTRKNLFEDNRGSSEAASHALLFLVVISLVGGISVAGDEVITTVQDEQALDQGVRGFTDVHETGKRFTAIGSQDEFATSGVSTNVKVTNSKLVDRPETNIEIDTGSTYRISTTPLMIDHSKFNLYYDAGVISSVKYPSGEKQTHWNPVNNEQLNDGVLRLTTIETNQSSVRETDSVVRFYIEQDSPPGHVELSDGDTITVETETPHGWKDYLSDYDFLTITDEDESSGVTTIEATVSTSGGGDVVLQHQKVRISFL